MQVTSQCICTSGMVRPPAVIVASAFPIPMAVVDIANVGRRALGREGQQGANKAKRKTNELGVEHQSMNVAVIVLFAQILDDTFAKDQVLQHAAQRDKKWRGAPVEKERFKGTQTKPDWLAMTLLW